jgi:cyanophycinase-like exopeptidase
MNWNKTILLSLLLLILPCTGVSAQNYVSYFTGNAEDVRTSPTGGTCLMGGSREDDNAMRWFLQRADGGDVLVLRTSGSDGYNDYLYGELGVMVNSVETIVFENGNAANEAHVHEAIQQAEAIWFAGGNQATYVNYWRGTAVDSLIREAVSNRKVVIGGTSAGMAILGGHYFAATNGTIRSAAALANPFDERVTIESDRFLDLPFLEDVVTDTHYDDPDRRGRHLVFLARMRGAGLTDPRGIACEERTAVCVDPSGLAMVFGEVSENDFAYFIRPSCSGNEPEILDDGVPLTWSNDEKALLTCRVKGTPDGTNTFLLTDWQTTSGGEWQEWYADSGVFNSRANTEPIDCIPSRVRNNIRPDDIVVRPNPAHDFLTVTTPWLVTTTTIVDASGVEIRPRTSASGNELTVNVEGLVSGTYFLLLVGEGGWARSRFVVP